MSRATVPLLLVFSLPAIAHAPLTTTVQFDREVVRILDNHCVMCHDEQGAAFPLVTYEQTYAARWKIRQDALDRHMAPWAAVAGYGDFVNSNALTQREIDFLVSWAESFGPRNNGEVYTGIAAATGPAPKVIQAHRDVERWVLGNPDLRLPLPEAQRIVLDPKLTSEHWLRGLEYKPGDRKAVHAVSFTIEETGQWIGSWTPWYGFVSLPRGLAYRLPAHFHIVAEIHSKGATQPASRQGTLGLYFTDQPSQRVVSNLALEAKGPAHRVVATTRLDADTSILALQPQLHAGLQSIEVSARAPNGTTQVLLFAKDIQTDWPTPYIFRTPVPLVKGTELSLTEHYTGDSSIPSAGARLVFSTYQGGAP